MAEVIGAVASGISIVQIVSQVASSIVKIKGFWDRVKAAPDDINHLLQEVDSFRLILEHIRDDLTRNALPELLFNNGGVRQSLELCRSGATELEELANELAGKLDARSGLRSRIGSFKAVLKHDDIKTLRRKLNNAIRLLSLAYQCHISAMIRLQPDIIVARLSTNLVKSSGQRVSELVNAPNHASNTGVARESASNTGGLVLQSYSYWTSSPSWLQLLVGSLEYRRLNRQRRGRDYEQVQARYRFPQGFSMRVWEVLGSRSLSDWSVNLRTYRIIPWEAPIYEAIKSRDIISVRKLLASREAFITDRDLLGTTLLHRAALSGTVDICRLLISEGADVCISAVCNYAPIHFAFFSKKENDSIVRLLVNHGACNASAREMDSMRRFKGETSLFQHLQQQTYPTYYETPLEDRIYVASRLNMSMPNSAELMRMAITLGHFDKTMVNYVNRSGRTILHYVMENFVRYYLELIRNAGDKSSTHNEDNNKTQCFEDIYDPNIQWRRLIKDIVIAGAPCHAIDDSRLSILLSIIHSVCCYTDYIMDGTLFDVTWQIINFWLINLQEAGVDLAQYGAEENSLLLAGKVDKGFNLWVDDNDSCGWRIELTGFSYGSQPKDWHFWFTEPTDFCAGEFWTMVETTACGRLSEFSIPGSWIESS